LGGITTPTRQSLKGHGPPCPPRPKKLDRLTRITAEFNRNAFEVQGSILFLRLRISSGERIKVNVLADFLYETGHKTVYIGKGARKARTE
jgi:hypothetical protein